MNTDKAVKLAFPKLKPQTRQIIADWYDNEDASDDFDNLRDYAEHIKFDLMDMIWAATDATEVKAVKDDLVACGYERADAFPEEEEDDSEEDVSPEENYDFEVKNGVLETYTGHDAEVIVPNTVTEIGADVFQGRSKIKSIVLPNSVTRIGRGAFGYCRNLESITIPNSVTYIDSMAFCWCQSLKSLHIPDSVTFLGEKQFFRCDMLNDLTLPVSFLSDVAKYEIPAGVRVNGKRYGRRLWSQPWRSITKISEGTKVTLTLGQLKRLVKESKAWPKEIEYDDEEFDVIDEPKKPRKSRKQQQAPVEDRILDLLQAIEDAGYKIVSPYSGVPGRRLYNVLGGGEDTKEKEFNELKDLVEQNGLTDIVRLRSSRSTSNAFYKYGKTDTNAFSLSWENTYKVGLKDLNTRNSDRKSSRLHMTSRYKDAHGKSGAAKSRHWQRQLGWLD